MFQYCSMKQKQGNGKRMHLPFSGGWGEEILTTTFVTQDNICIHSLLYPTHHVVKGYHAFAYHLITSCFCSIKYIHFC